MTVPGTSQGVSTDVDGNFTLKTDAKEIEISYVGYVPTKKPVTGPNARLGIIQMEPDAVALQDVIVMQSVAVQRKTPVAVSTVNAEEISYKLGGQEFPEILKSTPGVYVTKDGGGFGDSKINMRGFQAANVAVMVNGVPVNDMEWGGVYWSNWAGLSDVTRSMQTQRGLGASKISSPSVGGSVNIVTNGIEAKQGGTFSFGVGNDGLYSLSFSLSTGLTKSGWALSVLGAKRWGDGYIQGTNFEGYNWFVNISKRINDRHQLSLTAFGAPQKHAQRHALDDGLKIEEWQKAKNFMGEKDMYRYNAEYGFDKNGRQRYSHFNEYHKPQISLNHQWQIDYKSSLSTALYMSIGRGSGDKKTPLLRSMEAISKQAVRIVKLFGMDDVKKVSCSVGPEQEYFLVDRDKYLQRKDLIFTGRTLFGASAPKGQELDDHYFGAIKERIASFMKDLNIELWKLGILSKTQHNEVAPAQHEMAPIFTTANISTDHNQLVMEIMKKVAKRHNLECLLHEKPFAGVNGSGKHNNWSIVTDTGVNLLDPGKKPHENKIFLLFLASIIKAVDENAELLRLSASNPGNDHRLGANEAPPAIISIFLGEQLEDVVEQIVRGDVSSSIQGSKLDTGVHVLPVLKKDATDRNRTSPFAFTGNKFEFRMLGSSMSIAGANFVLNTIVADTLQQFADELEKADDFNKAVKEVIKKNITEHQRVIFNGDGYSDEWVAEAEKRGLPNVKSMVEAVPYLVTDKTVELFERQNVLSKAELESRAEINYENYSKTINIEAKTMIDMAGKQFIPAVISYVTSLADSVNTVTAACAAADVSVQTELLTKCSSLLAKAQKALANLEKVTAEAAEKEEGQEQALFFKNTVFVAMEELRAPIDELEMIVDQEFWPVPSYGDLLFEV